MILRETLNKISLHKPSHDINRPINVVDNSITFFK